MTWRAISARHSLTAEEERSLLDSLRFKPEDEWLHFLYGSMGKKYHEPDAAADAAAEAAGPGGRRSSLQVLEEIRGGGGGAFGAEEEDEAGALPKTITRPTLPRRTDSERPYDHSPFALKSSHARFWFECLCAMTLLRGGRRRGGGGGGRHDPAAVAAAEGAPGRAVQVDMIKTRVESAYGFST
jgi:hypothetical protein